MTGKETAKSEAGENPLVPNAKLRAMYVAMVEARVLEESVIKRRRNAPRSRRPASIRGQEAVRASIVLQLSPDDLISDVEVSAGMGSILGFDAHALLKTFGSPKSKVPIIPRLLPSIDDPEQRLQMALGAALALKAQGRQGVVFAYIPKDGLSAAAYTRILKPAAANELPIIFVVLPRPGTAKSGDGEATVAKVAGKAGVPGIPVDACDSVALYRVAQESLGRTRGGDGPVLIECVSWKPAGRAKSTTPTDPIEHLRHFLLGRKVSAPAWFKQTDGAALKRLKNRPKASRSS